MSHIQFADDTLFFVNNESHQRFFIDTLNPFGQTLGLKINMKKSALLGLNCVGEEEEEILAR